jgi:nitrite reductase/ring-hydroxylating ferredoxin subunit
VSVNASGSGVPSGTPILRAGELAPGQSRKFMLACGGRQLECFVVNWRGLLRAFVNQCRHIPMTLDWVENQFFDEAGDYLLCPTHGALYEPDGGECVVGPPCGKALYAVPLLERGDEVLALCPDPLPD